MTPAQERERAASMARHPAGRRGTQPLPGPALSVVEHPSVPPEENPPKLPDVATVTVKTKVDGTVKRKARGKGKRRSVTEPSHTHRNIKVDPRIMKAVRAVVKEGVYTRVTIVDAETVIVR